MGIQMLPQLIYWVVYVFIHETLLETASISSAWGPQGLQITQASEDE